MDINACGMIESVQHKKTAGGPDLAYRRYWRNNRDRIEAWKRGTDNSQNTMEDGRGDRYRYDPEGQLIEASYRVANPESWPGPALRADVFSYDELGNRVRWNHIASRGWMDLKRRDNGLNQYREWENNIPAPDPNHWGSGIFHDDNIPPNPSPPPHPFVPPGNGVLMQDGYITGGFNALNQPVAIWSFAYWNTPNWMFFGYDPLGRCVKRWVGSSGSPATNPATYFYYDGWNLIQEGAGGGTVDRVYVHGGRVDEIVASQAGGSWVYHHYDARGHCILLTNPSGNILEQYDYDAFGQPYFYSSTGQSLNSSTFGNRFLFTGREWIKDLKLYDYRNRMYQPELGRFLQPDPKHFAAGDYNLYRYCHNDPVNKSDPTGLFERFQDDFQWRNARFFDTANIRGGTMAEMNGTKRFHASVRSFTQEWRPEARGIDPGKIGAAAVADAKDDAGKVELRENGKWGIEQIAARYVDGNELVKVGPVPGLPLKNYPGGELPAPPPDLAGKVALIGTHAHGPQSGMKAELQKVDEYSARGGFTKGVPYISAVGSSVDQGARIQVYVPHYGFFNSRDGVTFSVGK